MLNGGPSFLLLRQLRWRIMDFWSALRALASASSLEESEQNTSFYLKPRWHREIDIVPGPLYNAPALYEPGLSRMEAMLKKAYHGRLAYANWHVLNDGFHLQRVRHGPTRQQFFWDALEGSRHALLRLMRSTGQPFASLDDVFVEDEALANLTTVAGWVVGSRQLDGAKGADFEVDRAAFRPGLILMCCEMAGTVNYRGPDRIVISPTRACRFCCCSSASKATLQGQRTIPQQNMPPSPHPAIASLRQQIEELAGQPNRPTHRWMQWKAMSLHEVVAQLEDSMHRINQKKYEGAARIECRKGRRRRARADLPRPLFQRRPARFSMRRPRPRRRGGRQVDVQGLSHRARSVLAERAQRREAATELRIPDAHLRQVQRRVVVLETGVRPSRS